ncbi:hypothetical protein MYXO_02778 [Myxococcaceae bacterium]|nr:hypothetical protein MYXO_02778 [Myxococcaceae bacterium]
MGKPGARRREHRREGVVLPVTVSTVDPEIDPATRRPFFRASREWSTNLSRGGLFLRTDQPFGAGRRLLLEITLAEHRTIEAVGRVAWTRRPLAATDHADSRGVGIEFLAISRDDAAAIERFLRSGSERARVARGMLA